MPSRLLALAVALGGLLGPAFSPTQAQNLLVNPHFDTDLGGWTPRFDTAWVGTRDAAGSPSSGSAGSLRFFVLFNCADALSQCVSGLHGGTRYDFGGKILIPRTLNQTTGGQGTVDVRWYADACGSALLGTATGPVVDSTANADVWSASDSLAVTAPPGTTSALVVGQNCVLGVGTVEMFFDDMFFQPTSVVAIPALDGRGIVLFILLLGASGLLALRRRAAWRPGARDRGRDGSRP